MTAHFADTVLITRNSILKRQWIWIGIILTVAAVLRFWGLGAESAWIDEAYTITLAKHSIANIIKGTAADQHPPLFYLMLHYWFLFGSGVAYARLLTAILGVINVGQIILLGDKLGGPLIALPAGLLLAVSPVHIWYSKEVRMYILLVVFTTAATSILWDCLHGKNRWLLYCLFAVLALYSHYFAAFVLFAHAVFTLLWSWLRKEWKTFYYWTGSMLFAAVAFIPWAPVAVYQMRYHTMSWIQLSHIGDVRDVIVRLFFGETVQQLSTWARWGCLILLAAILAWTAVKLRRASNQQRQQFTFLLTWAFVPLMFIPTIGAFYPIFQFKQFLIVLVPLILVTVWITHILPRSLGLFFISFLLVGSLFSTINQQTHLSKDDWRGAAAYIQGQVKDGDILLYNAGSSAVALNLYLNQSIPGYGYPQNFNILDGGWAGRRLTSAEADTYISSISQGRKRIWLVEYAPNFWDPNQLVEHWLDQHSTQINDKNFKTIRVRLFELPTGVR
jgi:uncharacterized membrane protein